MYLHIGNNHTVPISEILGIFDCDTSTISVHTKNYLKAKGKLGLIVSDIDDIPKSFIVTVDGTVYMSTLASSILLNRLRNSLSFAQFV